MARGDKQREPVYICEDDEARQMEQDHLARSGVVDPLPTAAEIAAECERLQAGWSRVVRRTHLVTHNPRPRIKQNPLTIRFSVKNRSE